MDLDPQSVLKHVKVFKVADAHARLSAVPKTLFHVTFEAHSLANRPDLADLFLSPQLPVLRTKTRVSTMTAGVRRRQQGPRERKKHTT